MSLKHRTLLSGAGAVFRGKSWDCQHPQPLRAGTGTARDVVTLLMTARWHESAEKNSFQPS
jgi:hypothetical protein